MLTMLLNASIKFVVTQAGRYVKEPKNPPFCLFLMLVIFRSLAPPREANGRRAGEAIVAIVVILKFWLKGQILLLCLWNAGEMLDSDARPRR